VSPDRSGCPRSSPIPAATGPEVPGSARYLPARPARRTPDLAVASGARRTSRDRSADEGSFVCLSRDHRSPPTGQSPLRESARPVKQLAGVDGVEVCELPERRQLNALRPALYPSQG